MSELYTGPERRLCPYCQERRRRSECEAGGHRLLDRKLRIPVQYGVGHFYVSRCACGLVEKTVEEGDR